jgi:hypothetical protein
MQTGVAAVTSHAIYSIGDGLTAFKILNVDFRDTANLFIAVKDLTNSVDKLLMIGKSSQ